IAAMNLLRFGSERHKKTPALLAGVVKGIGGYGNCFGVPTVYSDADFDAAYDGNILVNAFALGVLRADRIFKGSASGVGNPVMYVGAKTGRDGIHGATMASDSFSEHEAVERPTVQVGDPFKEKLLMEACQECFQASSEGEELLVGIQDMGAAGLTSSMFEMASRAGSGVLIDLDKVPARETGMSAYELMLSESQERMLLVAKRGQEERVRAIFAKWDLDCVEIGTVTDDGRVRLMKDGVLAGDLPARALADEAPKYARAYTEPVPQASLDEAPLRALAFVDVARALLTSSTLAPKRWIYERYDREVGAGTLLDGTRASAALVRIPDTRRAVAMALVCNTRLCASDPEGGAALAVVDGVLRVSAVGAEPVGVTDCLNYGDPQKPAIMGQLVAGVAGIKRACTALSVPVVSGNVSLYNQTDDRAVHPTPTIGVVGLLEDLHQVIPRAPIVDGDAVVRIGLAPRSLSGSLALSRAHGGVPSGALHSFDLATVKASADLVRELVRGRALKDARAISTGGLVSALFEIVRSHGLGVFADLPLGEDAFIAAFGEAPAFLAVVSASQLADVADRAAVAGVAFETLGAVGGHALAIAQRDQILAELPVAALIHDADAVVANLANLVLGRSERAAP
ncbi:MAG TPA: phosphoribosylformylglycinamidine synthase subunit PurL, partial [Myxococcota bacterium]